MRKGRNILFVADVSISNVIGGAERVLYEQTKRLAAKGHNVHIITRKMPVHQSCRGEADGVIEWRYEACPARQFQFIRQTLQGCRRLFETLHLTHSFDVINFHQPFSAYAISRSELCLPVKKMYTCHSLSFEEFISRRGKPVGVRQYLSHWLNVTIRKYIERRALQVSDTVTVLSDYTRKKLIETHSLSPEMIRVIPGGVDLDKFRPTTDKNADRKCLGLPQDRILLLTVRNLVPRMGLENLLRAFKNVRDSEPRVCLVIGGQGSLLGKLKILSEDLHISRDVIFAGFIPEAQLPCYYGASDFFILPTIELEGFGLITLEALASGIPVLGTPIGGTLEILNRFDSKYLFHDTSPEAMADLIIHYCRLIREKPEEWTEISPLCRKFVEDHYSWDLNIERLEALF